MKKAKAILWVLIIGFILLFFFQNQNFFFAKQSLIINLLFVKYKTPELAAAVIYLVFFAAGLLISYFFSLPERFRFKKTIKTLNATVDSKQKELTAAKKDLELLSAASADNKGAGE